MASSAVMNSTPAAWSRQTAGRPRTFRSRRLETKDATNAADTAEEIDRLRRDGDGHIAVWAATVPGSYSWAGPIDEFHLDWFSYISREGTRLFNDDRKSYQPDLVSGTGWNNETVGLHYWRHR
jgi:hypothetical protein